MKNEDKKVIYYSIATLLAFILFTLFIDYIFVTPEITIEDITSVSFTRTQEGTNPEAAITIFKFSDYSCSFCKQANKVITQIRTQYDNDINFIYKHFPRDQTSLGASIAAECARDQNKFSEFSNELFRTTLTKENYLLIAGQLQLDVTTFQNCLLSGSKSEKVELDVGEGVSAGVQGTPTYFINGKKFEGHLEYKELQQIIESLK